MQGLSKHTTIERARRGKPSRGIVTGIAIVGAAGIGGLVAGFTVRPGLGPESSSTIVAATIANMAPSDIVNLRFPADWAEAAAADAAAPQMLAFASADGAFTLFNPRPIYPIADTNALTPPAAAPAKPKSSAQTASAQTAAAPAKMMTLASASSRPAVVAATKPAQRSNAVLNDSQIVSIKKRLALTADQERYWPAVEAELRKIEYRKDKSAQGTRMAQVDVSKVDVEGLKSAGFPLVMSFSDDQRRELKSLAHLLGLESAMAGI